MTDFIQPGPLAKLNWALIDLDGTLAESVWTPENPTSGIGPPIKKNVAKAISLHNRGWKIVIHTARAWTDYEAIEAWCDYHGIPARRIVAGKLLGGIMIDDRNVPIGSPDWADPEGEAEAAWTSGFEAGYQQALDEME
jgi:hypothetical protein